MATVSRYHGSLCLEVDGARQLLGPLDAWRVIEAWSICTTYAPDWSWPPVGRAGRRDYDTIYWETDAGRWLLPYETAVLIMTGELKEAMATLDMQPGPPKPAPGALVEREAMPELRDWWGEECPDRRGE